MIAHRFIGIDISGSRLDVFDEAVGRLQRIANRAEAIAAFLAVLPPQGVRVIYEATGAYDRHLAQALAKAGIESVRVNPARARDFARAAGLLAKTDAIDARMLAAMGRAIAMPAAEAPDPARDRLARLHRRRDALIADRADEKKRRSIAVDDLERASIEAHIAWLDAEIGRLEQAIAASIEACGHLRALRRQLQTAPGVGKVTLVTLIAGLPELGHRSARRIAALAGLAPFNDDSGSRRGKRRIQGGRRRVRQALYMAALAAIRKVPRFKAHYQGVASRSGSRKAGIIAVARKLLVALNAMLRTGQPFRA
jgi:transposase